MDKTKERAIRKSLTWGMAAVLVALGIRYTLFLTTELKYDIAISLLGLAAFAYWHEHFDQDLVSYSGFLALLLLHNLYLYESAPLGIRFDHYMHFVGGAVIALIADRMFLRERWSRSRRAIVLIFLTLGVGALHEIIEWAGYGILGEGDGFLFFGAGDEGEWRNSMLDLIFDMLGAIAVATAVCLRRTYRKQAASPHSRP